MARPAKSPPGRSRLRPSLRSRPPGLSAETSFWDAGHEVVVGVDEVGRGAWAGPLTIAAVVVPQNRRLYKVRDSKLLNEGERERLYERVCGWADAWAVGHATQHECDELGMSAAQRLAARRALTSLSDQGARPDAVMIDGRWDFVSGASRPAEEHPCQPVTQTLVKGDATSLGIAAASVLAKVTRDRIMRHEALHYPGYDFERNKGYPCPRHRVALAGMGPTSIHRRSWVFMDYLPWPGLARPSAGMGDGQGQLPFGDRRE